jgi:copper oxidase (laccase) domain-containing protein
VAPSAWSETTWGTPALDIAAGVRAQLEALGVDVVDLADAVGRSAACTLENEHLYSYRRQGRRSGRLGGLVRLTGPA